MDSTHRTGPGRMQILFDINCVNNYLSVIAEDKSKIVQVELASYNVM